MKYASQALVTLMALGGATAFVTPQNAFSSSARLNTELYSDIVTGPEGKAAKSKEEDLALTLAIIMAHDDRSVTVTEEQFKSQQVEAISQADAEPIDISIPYDAAALLAYEATEKSISFEEYKPKYYEETVAFIKSKQPIDISIPYDAAAKLAYEATDMSISFEEYKPKYYEETVAFIKSKQPIDISIPYDAAAKLAYEATEKSISFEEYKPKYYEETVAFIKSKQTKAEEE